MSEEKHMGDLWWDIRKGGYVADAFYFGLGIGSLVMGMAVILTMVFT